MRKKNSIAYEYINLSWNQAYSKGKLLLKGVKFSIAILIHSKLLISFLLAFYHVFIWF